MKNTKSQLPEISLEVSEAADLLETKLSHLKALLEVSYGMGGVAFRQYDNEIQDAYLWACSDLASDCDDLLQVVVKGMT